MSALIYPALPGQDIQVIRNYIWKTGYQEALSGKQSAISWRQFPLVHFELVYNVLRRGVLGATQDELQAIVGFYNAMRGRFDTFLFRDPTFNTITPANAAQYGVFGTGDGTTKTFQLVASFQNSGGPGAPEIIQNIDATNGAPIVYSAGVPAVGYTIGATGIVTFNGAPITGHQLTWSGSWYYRCRFEDDAIVWKQSMNNLWSADSVKFQSVKL